MLFWIFVVLSIIGAVIWWFNRDNYRTSWDSVGKTIFWIAFVVVLVSVICFCFEYIGVDARIESNIIRYNQLTYLYENDVYELDIYKHDLLEQIEEWNENVAHHREIQDDFWVGIYWADIYDRFELIELAKVE